MIVLWPVLKKHIKPTHLGRQSLGKIRIAASGQSLVELLAFLPLFFTLTAGVFIVGLSFYVGIQASNTTGQIAFLKQEMADATDGIAEADLQDWLNRSVPNDLRVTQARLLGKDNVSSVIVTERKASGLSGVLDAWTFSSVQGVERSLLLDNQKSASIPLSWTPRAVNLLDPRAYGITFTNRPLGIRENCETSRTLKPSDLVSSSGYVLTEFSSPAILPPAGAVADKFKTEIPLKIDEVSFTTWTSLANRACDASVSITKWRTECTNELGPAPVPPTPTWTTMFNQCVAIKRQACRQYYTALWAYQSLERFADEGFCQNVSLPVEEVTFKNASDYLY